MKKKIIIIITIIFFLTGCFGEVGRGIITNECTKQEQNNNINILTTITLKSTQGNINNINITEIYDTNTNITSIINSKKSEANMYKNESGIKINIENQTVTYEIDTTKASNLVIERFKINNQKHKMIKYYEENGYKCK